MKPADAARRGRPAGAPAPRRMDLRVIAQAGERRTRALAEADAALDAIVAELVAAGERRNVKLAADLAGVTRRTLYARLRAEETATTTRKDPAA